MREIDYDIAAADYWVELLPHHEREVDFRQSVQSELGTEIAVVL
jgi:hypothetical protein